MPVYLERANSNGICRCTCERSLVSSPVQMDCPWCGCGWLFTCMTCQKAYTFARGVEVDTPLEDLARRDLTRRRGRDPSDDDVAEWVEWMALMLEDVVPGVTYVYLDGFYLPADTTDLELEGVAAVHSLPTLPHVEALTDPRALSRTLADRAYWLERAVEADPD